MFSPTRQTSRAPSANRRGVFGESHEGSFILLRTKLVRRIFGTLTIVRIDLYLLAYGWQIQMKWSVSWRAVTCQDSKEGVYAM